MSQDGELVFYCVHEPLNPREVLAMILHACRPSGAFTLSRTTSPRHDWRDFLGQRQKTVGGIQMRSLDARELLTYQATVEDAVASWSSEYVITASDISSDLAIRVRNAVRDAIPDGIRGCFDPSSITVIFGWHDVFECTEREEGQLFAQPFVSIRFSGYGVPNNWKECRRRMLALPEIQSVRRVFESVVAPMGECVYWNG